MFDDDKHSEPLEVRPALPRRLSDVQGDQGAVWDDAGDGRDPEGEIPAPDVTNSDGFGLPGQITQLVPVSQHLGQIVDQGDGGRERIDSSEQEDVTELEPKLHEVIMKGVKRIREGIVVNKTNSLIILIQILDTRDISWLGFIIYTEFLVQSVHKFEGGGLV